MKILPIPNDNITKVCDLLNQLIGDVTSKNLFTGYGLFHKQKDMFAVWVNNKVYLRAKDELSIKLKGLGCKSFTTNELNKRFVLSDYYALTESILKDNVLMRTLIILSITQIRKEKLDLALSKIGRIRDLPNLSIKYERALNKVGVDNVDTLRKIGAENAIVRLKKADISASEAFYWRLRGALENRNCEFYTEKEKERGLSKLNEILSANGFRRCKRASKKVS
ncbi:MULTISPECIES: TfoX/Sxy family DNA transformation protein [Haemophilus]|uniref:TfoX/Sxy family DNA transformation protein n=1 Tax=Haemophilus TaxID=724 RepID=UPI000B332D8B|nr:MULTISPECIES: TfoX/Sxy family DNA transformation protein [Haemophilus]KAB1991876.1 TfoX/Sxy family DNA transformation protein [Haemophilus parainfluenzae]MBS6189207.1 TfoX/Sxy family DNA transformation protein [Haemophilus parainfluenzae]MDN3212523.1 TfoX/Sxy family DNA transformation protein [Haemophilus sp. SZY H51]MDU4895805.1 TfoX/Sxy family DNA transformation protein [Haemophilus parainfluenzae]MDU6708277.1 TfoX/Sxy family DNA transformation protein [Haemophilus parainfluenzae]